MALTPEEEARFQELYASVRADGYLDAKKNPRLHDLAASLVKDGTLRDLSGGSTYAPAEPTAQEMFDSGSDTPDPRDPYAKKAVRPRTQAARTTSDQSRYTSTYAPMNTGRGKITPFFDDTKTPPAPKQSPVSAAVRRYAQTVLDAAAAAVTPAKDPRAPRGLGYPEMGVAGAVAAPVSNSVRNFTQGALAPGLARMGNRDGDPTALSAIQDIFGDIPGNIKAGARAVLNDSGPQAIGRQVPELAPGTMAGDVLNTLTGLGSDPLNLLLAPTGLNLPGVRALSAAGKERGFAGIAKAFADSMEKAGPNVLQKGAQSARNTAYAGARKTAEVAGDAVYGRGMFAPEVETGKVGRTSRIPRGAVKVEGEARTAPVRRGRMIEGKVSGEPEVNVPSAKTESAPVPPEAPPASQTVRSRVSNKPATVPGESAPASAANPIVPTVNEKPVAKVAGVGSEGVTYTPDDNTPVPYRWRVVDADTLKPSQTDTFAPAPGYPQELQPRDRTRTASQAQVAEIAQGLNPARLGEAPTTADGAPVVGADGFVESGNGRTLAIRRAYNQHPERAAAYKESVLSQAQALGVDPAEIARMAKPVLVRERTGELDLPARAALAEKMGKSTVAGMSEPEVATSDGRALRNSPALERYTQGADILSTANNDFRRAFVEMLPQGERAGLMQSDGTMSAAGVRRVRNALLASAYDDTHALTRLTEATDDNIRSVGQAMEQTAPAVARVRNMATKGNADPAFDITSEVTRAANTLSNLRAQNETVAGHLAQGALFGDETTPVGEELLKLFDDHKRRPKVIADTLAQYARGWEIAGPADSNALFDMERPDSHALLRAARTYAEEKNGTKTQATADLFQTDTRAEPAKGGGGAPDAKDRTPAKSSEAKPAVKADDPSPAAPKKRVVKPRAKKTVEVPAPADNTDAFEPQSQHMTLKQFTAQHKRFIKESTGYYDGPEGDADYDYAYPPDTIKGLYYGGIEQAMSDRKAVDAKSLDAFFIFNKERTGNNNFALNHLNKFPLSAPKGYLPPDARAAQKEEDAARLAGRRRARETAKDYVPQPKPSKGTSTSTGDKLASPLRAPIRGALPANSVAPGTVPARIPIAPIPSVFDGRKIADITADLSKALGKNVQQDTRVASRRAKNSGGHYYPGDGRIVVSSTNDLDTVAHDLAHYVDDKTGLVAAWVDTTKGASPFDAELIPAFSEHGSKPPVSISLGVDAKGKAIPVTGEGIKNGGQVTGPFDILHSTDPVTSKDLWTVKHKKTGAATTFTRLNDATRHAKDLARFEGEALVITRAEGVAEWLRAYLLNPDAAKAAAPGFTAYYESHVPQKMKDALRTFGDQARQHAGMSDIDKVRASRESLEPNTPGLKDRAKETVERIKGFFSQADEIGGYKTSGLDALREKVTDEFAPVVSGVRELRTRTGKAGEFDVLPKNDPVLLLRQFTYFKQKFDSMLEHGVTNANDEVVGSPLASVFEPLMKPNMTEAEFNEEVEIGIDVAISQRVVDEARKIDARTAKVLQAAQERLDRWLAKKTAVIEDRGAAMVATRTREVSIRERTRAGVLSSQAKGRAARKIVKGVSARKSVKGKARVVRRVTDALAKGQNRRVVVTQNRIAASIIPRKDAVEASVSKAVAEAQAQAARSMARMQGRAEAGASLKKGRLIAAGAGSENADEVAARVLGLMQQAAPTDFARYTDFAARLRAQANDVLQYMVDKGRYTQEYKDGIMASNEYWISLQRILDETPIKQFGESKAVRIGGKSILAARQNIHAFEGSMKTVRNPLVSVLEQMYAGVKEADRNEILDKITDLIPEPGRKMYGAPVADVSAIVQVAEAGAEGARKVYKNGELKYFRFEPGIDRALNRAGEVFLPNLLEAVGMLPAKLKRFTATRTPGYYARNIIRDRAERLAKSRTSTPLTAQGFKEEWLNTVVPSTEEERFFTKLLGGFIAETNVVENATDFYRTQNLFLRQLAKLTNKPTMLRNIITAADIPGRIESGERSTRILEYRTAYRYAKSKGLDDANARRYAAGEARDLQDFNKGGTYTKVINRYIAFTNAQVQGLTRLGAPVYEGYQAAGAKGAAKATGEFGKRVAFLSAIPAVGALLFAAAAGKDKLEEYREHPAYLRDMFYLFPYGPNSWIAIPKPHEVGVLGSGAERALDYAAGNRNAFAGYGNSMKTSFVPVDNTLLTGGEWSTYFEVLANYDLFKGGPIISPFENDRAISERPGTARASRLGQALGSVANSDPRKVDFVIQSTTGDYGRLAQTVSDIGRADKPRNVQDMARQAAGVLKPAPATAAPSVQAATARTREAGIAKDPLKDEKDAYYGAITNEEKDAAARALRAAARSPRVSSAVDTALARRRETSRIVGPSTPQNAADRRSFSSVLTAVIKRLEKAGAPAGDPATIREAADLAAMKRQLADLKEKQYRDSHAGAKMDGETLEKRVKAIRNRATSSASRILDTGKLQERIEDARKQLEKTGSQR